MSQLSTFHVGKYLFGVDVSLVQEVVRLQQMTPVPLATDEIAGLINLRGEVLTAIDLRARLGLPPVDVAAIGASPSRGRPRGRRAGQPARRRDRRRPRGFPGAVRADPSTVDERVRDLLLGAYTLPDRLLLALNARRVLDVGGESRAA